MVAPWWHACVPVTLVTGAAAVVLSMLAWRMPESASAWATVPGISWAVHADGRHLVHDVGVLLLLGGWAERRAGSGRVALWLLTGIVSAYLLHAVLYPAHGALMGLSAACWLAGGAAAWGCVGSARCRAAATVVLGLVLALECVTPWREILGAVSFGTGGAMTFDGITLETVPLVHQGCAVIGAVLGWAGRRWPAGAS